MTRSSNASRAIFLVGLALALLLAGSTPAAAARTVIIRGGGYGNGIGMSQYGAYGRALSGATGEEIVKHYYTDTQVSKLQMPPRVRVGILQYRSTISIATSEFTSGGGEVVWRVEGRKGILARAQEPASWRVEVLDSGAMRLLKNNRIVEIDGRSAFGSPSRPLTLNYAPYGSAARILEKGLLYRHGKLVFGSYPTSPCGSYCLRAVAVVDMQEYLLGLAEMPASWPLEALRAQVIAGRTYALDKILRLGQHRSGCDCAVFDSTYDQVYVGDARRTSSGDYWPRWRRAVRSTEAQVILHDGRPIQAFYSSSSGGHTENNENVWGGTPLPYLRGVRDRADATDINPFHRWTVSMGWTEFSERMHGHYGTGSLRRVKLLEPFGVSGRVTVVKSPDTGGARVVGSDRTVHVSGASLAHVLGLRDTLFRITITYDVGTRFESKYAALDGAPGYAVSKVYEVPRRWDEPLGRAQDFERGRLTWNRATDEVVWQWGKILARYDAARRERSGLGMPTSDVWGPGRYLGGSYVNGIIVWSRTHGAYTVRGAFRTVYRNRGGPGGALGVPLTERQATDTLPRGGRRQRFANGTLYLNPHLDRVFALRGPIDARYRWMGEASGRCGYPESHVRVREGVHRASFARGVIRWSESAGFSVRCD